VTYRGAFAVRSDDRRKNDALEFDYSAFERVPAIFNAP
jgi:hypothetical protein